MAIYYIDMKMIGGGAGRSAVGAAAYRAGEKLVNEKSGTTHDFTKRRSPTSAAAYHSGEKINEHDFRQKSGIVYSEIMLPSHAPEAYQDRATLWNAAENAEPNHNSRTGREIVVALPNELTPEQQIKLVRDYVQRNFVDEGMCADFSIHAGHIHDRPNEVYPFENLTVRKENPHAHIQLTTRPINKDGTWGAKSKKEYILDRNGERIRLPSGNWKSRKVDATDWDKTETLVKWRKDWADTVNKEFERLGIDERISHLSLKEQGIDREPTKHMGHKAWNLEKKGIKTEIGNKNRDIMEQNRALEIENNQGKLSTRKDLANIRKEQANANEVERPTHSASMEQINSLQKEYNEIERDLQWCAEKHREIQRLEHQAREMLQRSGEVRNKQGREYFKRKYGFEPEAAGAEVRRNTERAEALKQELQWQENELLERKNEIEIQHQILRRHVILDEYTEEMERRRIYERTR